MPRLDAIGVIVTDLKRSADFYRSLGVAFADDPDPEGHGHAEATLEGGMRFMLDTTEGVTEFDPSWTPPTGGHRMAVAFRCDSPAALNELFAGLVTRGAGVHKEPWDAFWGQRYAQILDPDGNVVDLFAQL
ncbi:MAG: VOC family protein [Candidatus Dormibacterales bacterium]